MINCLILLTVIFWGLSFVATKMALQYLTPIEIVAIRLLLGVPILYLVIMIKKIGTRFHKADYGLILIASLILGGHFLIQALGMIYTSATNTAWLVATIPIFIACFSYFFLKERITVPKAGGIALAAAGVLILVSSGQLGTLGWLKSRGDWIILASAVTWAIYTIITRNITRRYNPLAVSFAILVPPAIILNIFCSLTTPVAKIVTLPLNITLALIFLGVFCLGLAHWFWLEGLSRKGATEVGAYIYIEPLVTTVAAIPILGEKLTFFIIIGAIIIIAGVYLVQKKNSANPVN
jgi:drug/metabolite transporter (DMT)-like permease